MIDSEFEQFLSAAVETLQTKNDLLTQQYGLGRFARWDHNGEFDQLTFSDPGDATVLVADTIDIGSFSLKTKTWLWAWANESLTDAARAKAAALKALFDVTGMDVFIEPHIECDEYLAWELAAMSVEQLGGIGCYRGPSGHLWIFWSIDRLATVRRAT